jgi:flagellin-like protein
MRRKGISPLIAAVLLIAFTMAVASLFAQWAPSLFRTTQGEIDETAADIQSCSQYNLEVQESNKTHATIQQVAGPDALGNITVTWFYNATDPVQQYTYISNAGGVNVSNTTESAAGSTWTKVEAQSQECRTIVAQRDNPDYVNGQS